MAGNEVENCDNARNPADGDDGNSGGDCVPLILIVQWLFDDHVDALIEYKYQDSAQTSSTCKRSVIAPPNPVMRMSMKMTARKTRRTGRMAKGKRTLLNTRWSIVIHATAMANAA